MRTFWASWSEKKRNSTVRKARRGTCYTGYESGHCRGRYHERGSALKAAEAAKAFGLEVIGVVGVIDRLEGGRANFEAASIPLVTLFTIDDFIPPQNAKCQSYLKSKRCAEGCFPS